MRLSACTRLLRNVCAPFTDEAAVMKEMGFDGMDFDLNFMLSEKIGEDWRSAAESFAERAAQLDVKTVQTHLPYGYLRDVGPQGADPRAVREAVEASAILKAPYAVFHAVSTPDKKDGLKATYDFYMPYVEMGKRLGVELLIEVMPDYVVYPQTAEELCIAADKMGIGVCWDFGHPNVNKRGKDNDQREELRLIGKRLKAIHANDNFGTAADEHLVPFLGTLNFKTHIPVLKEIGYEGDFNFEVLPFRVPQELILSFGKYLADTGRYLIDLYNNSPVL